MKNKLLIIFFLLFVTGIFKTNAQYDYYLGYQNGFKYGCQCNDLPPKNVALVSGTKEEGYKDGKLDGVIYAQKKTATSNGQTYDRYKPLDYSNPAVYSPDYDLLERALQQKQNLINQRKASIQGSLNNVLEIIAAAEIRNNGLTESQQEYFNSFSGEVNKLSTYDISIEANYINILNWLQGVKNNVLKW